MFRIGEFSKIAQVSGRLLRYYDQIGLLKPISIDAQTGYRARAGAGSISTSASRPLSGRVSSQCIWHRRAHRCRSSSRWTRAGDIRYDRVALSCHAARGTALAGQLDGRDWKLVAPAGDAWARPGQTQSIVGTGDSERLGGGFASVAHVACRVIDGRSRSTGG